MLVKKNWMFVDPIFRTLTWPRILFNFYLRERKQRRFVDRRSAVAQQRSLYPPFQRRKSRKRAKNRFGMEPSSGISVVDLQSPKEHKSAKEYVNFERPSINAIKLRKKKKPFSATNVGVIFKPNSFMEKNILKSEKSKRDAKKQQLLNRKKSHC